MPTILIRYCHSEVSEIFRIYSVNLFWIFLRFGKRSVLLNQIMLLWRWKQYVISKRCSNPEDHNFEQLLLWKPENWFNYWIIKVKWSRYRPAVAQAVGRGIALLFHDCGTRRGWVVSSTPRPHFTPGKDPVPILQKARWAPGPVWTGGKSRPHRDSIPDRPTRSQSLYRLSYPAHNWIIRTRNLRQVTLFLNLLLLFADFWKSEAWIFVPCIGEVLLYASVSRIAPYRRRVGRYWICGFLYFAVL